jgi:hypothetical protein
MGRNLAVTAQAFATVMERAKPRSTEHYKYDLAKIEREAARAAGGFKEVQWAGVDISPGDGTRYQFVVAWPLGWRDPILAVLDDGCMFLPQDALRPHGMHSDYAQSKMPNVHHFTVAFVCAFLAEMGVWL